MKEIIQLFLAFAKIGAVTFGGGYAMLPILQRDIVNKYGWATDDELMDYFAIGQCTPGVIAVNTATFIGYKRRGIPGAVSSTLGVIAPSIVIITVIAAFIGNFSHIPAVRHALAGINAAVAVLVLSAVISLSKRGIKNIFGVCLFLAAAAISIFTKWSAVYIVLGAIAAGLIYGAVCIKKAGDK